MFATRSAQSVAKSFDSSASHVSAFVQYVAANESQSAAVAGGVVVVGGFVGAGSSSFGGGLLGGFPGSPGSLGSEGSAVVVVEPELLPPELEDEDAPAGPRTSLADDPEHPTSARQAKTKKEALIAPRAKQVPCLMRFSTLE